MSFSTSFSVNKIIENATHKANSVNKFEAIGQSWWKYGWCAHWRQRKEVENWSETVLMFYCIHLIFSATSSLFSFWALCLLLTTFSVCMLRSLVHIHSTEFTPHRFHIYSISVRFFVSHTNKSNNRYSTLLVWKSGIFLYFVKEGSYSECGNLSFQQFIE